MPIRRFLVDENAATAIEYCLIVALVIITLIGALQALGQQELFNVFDAISNVITENDE